MNEHDHADTLGGASSSNDAVKPANGTPSLVIGSQYLRSISMDVQNTPDVFRDIPSQPHLAMALDVTGRQLADGQMSFEVCVVVRAHGLAAAPTQEEPNPRVLYDLNVSYAGLFGLKDITAQDQVEPLLLVEAPTYIFPALRGALLNTIREAGFPTSNIQPVDFEALWHTRRAQQA
ncbi:protein-export chaperone SecB [Gluconobacter wancherniae]|uniref:protein-export chaperone SecB n=1 Tax=Gluconobacter wancherniae TaxID=1307955 RepID=UPI001B8D93B3|nr:protein-export chaperone SecB [Gluconobacter wancherniae]MBS1088188.1 protein-export chaperone SecB [Gluconobacter wancherniae]MBS1093874.1 protein-export chaperone SecB [Gluconobacter wancherniae]